MRHENRAASLGEGTSTLTKRELVIDVATRLGYTQNEVSSIVQSALDTVVDRLAQGDRLEVRNFGVFEVKSRDARTGRNPRTGEEVPIVEKRIVSFKPGKTLKEWVEAGPGADLSTLFDSSSPAPARPVPAKLARIPHSVPVLAVPSPPEVENPGEQQSLF